MPTSSVRAIHDKYRDEQLELEARLVEIETQIAELHRDRTRIEERLGDIVPLIEDAAALLRASGALDAGSPEPRRRTTSKPASRRAADVHSLGIVDAAIHLAREHGVKRGDSGDVQHWFTEVGYETRNGTPTRNSIYVSLHRAASKAKKGIEHVGGGVFVFPV